jgi:hypothetical protein
MDNSGTYRVMYTLTVSGTYDASVVLGATGIVNRYLLCFLFTVLPCFLSQTYLFRFKFGLNRLEMVTWNRKKSFSIASHLINKSTFFL